MFNLSDPLDQTTNHGTLTKYKIAGQIATKTIDEILKQIKVDAKLIDLCNIGHKFITQECDKIYNDIKYKGLAFPISISKNNIAGYYIPNNEDKILEGDLIKIDLGVHIDGFPALICFTTVIKSNIEATDKRSKVMQAAIDASKEIYTIMKPGKSNMDVVNIMKKYAEKYDCNLPLVNEYGNAPGVFSYQISRYIIDGYNDDDNEYVHRFILPRHNPNYEFSMRENDFEEGEVYAIDILMSSGSGKLNIKGDTNIYRRNHEHRCDLKLKTSKETLGLFNKERFPLSLKDQPNKIKLGIRECVEKKLLEPYLVTGDKETEYIARIKFTVMVKDDPILICGKKSDAELSKINKN